MSPKKQLHTSGSMGPKKILVIAWALKNNLSDSMGPRNNYNLNINRNSLNHNNAGYP